MPWFSSIAEQFFDLDNDKISSSFLKISVAFDTIDHKILLSRLNSVFGIQSTAL